MTTQEIREMIAVMQAYADGKTIQILNGKEWEDVEHPDWNWDYDEYRIKPEQKLRPYKDANEFLEAQQKHGLYLKHITEMDINRTPICVGSCGINVYKENKITFICFPDLLISCVWKDGTPCGILE